MKVKNALQLTLMFSVLANALAQCEKKPALMPINDLKWKYRILIIQQQNADAHHLKNLKTSEKCGSN